MDANWVPPTKKENGMRARGYTLYMLVAFLFSKTSGKKPIVFSLIGGSTEDYSIQLGVSFTELYI